MKLGILILTITVSVMIIILLLGASLREDSEVKGECKEYVLEHIPVWSGKFFILVPKYRCIER